MRCRSRVNITRGNSSPIVTAMYGYDLSSRRRMLNGGRCRLIMFCSSSSASFSVLAASSSMSSIRPTSSAVIRVAYSSRRKYDCTRLRSDFALPTYSTSPFPSRNRYTPGLSGRLASRASSRCLRSSLDVVATA